MTRKTKAIILLSVLFIIITVAGGIYTLGVQGADLRERDDKLVKLRESYSSVETLNLQLKDVEKRVASVDSLLFSGKFTIPQNLSQSRFFDFIDAYSGDNALYTFTNTE